LEFS
jgi:mRNA interferase HicA